VSVEARGPRLLLVAVLAVAGDRQEANRAPPPDLAQSPRQLVAVHDPQTDVEQRHRGLKLLGGRKRLGGVVGDHHLVPGQGQRLGEDVRGICVVVDHQDPGVQSRAP
jgi:hypothetical protein